MSITVLQARTLLQQGARNAGVSGTFSSDPYTSTEADLAIQDSLNHFARETKCIQTTQTATLPSGTNEIDLSGLTGFEPERWLRIWPVAVDTTSTVQTKSLVVREYDELLHDRLTCTETGAPTEIAFATTLTDAITRETSDQAYTIHFKHWTLLTSFTAGTSTTGTVLNISYDIAAQVLRTYGVVLLQRNQPEQIEEGVLQGLQAEYDRYLASKRGVGSMGARFVKLRSLAEIRAEGG